jgi:ATP-binding cassette subfamily B protein
MVFQDVYLFRDTIRNNITVGMMDATQEELEWAAMQACCHEFIMKLSLGYDTPVGEGGCTLSGGEKQRIPIARAFLKDAPIVLLDEATASLDHENERDVRKANNALVENKTVMISAHRLKTIKEADKIIVLENGRIAEEGYMIKCWQSRMENESYGVGA